MKLLHIITAAVGGMVLFSCADNELCYREHPHGQAVTVVINWADEGLKPANGMRLNLFPRNDCERYGIEDLGADGGTIHLAYASQHMGLCYDYFDSNNIAFKAEDHDTDIEAYCTPLVRATYSRAFPTENTVSEPSRLYVDKIDSFLVPHDHDEPAVMEYNPVNAVRAYTVEVTGVRGARYITDTRGAISGVSASYFLSTQSLASKVSTLLFSTAKDSDGDRVTGGFNTFGFIGTEHTLTIEILYPSAHNGIIQLSWDVSDQVAAGTTHIVVDANIDIIPDSNGGGSGFEADVEEWADVVVPIPM